MELACLSGRTEHGATERLGWWLDVAALGDGVPLSAVLTCGGRNRREAFQRVKVVTEGLIEPPGASLYRAGHPPRFAR